MPNQEIEVEKPNEEELLVMDDEEKKKLVFPTIENNGNH
jgi:hypothetical protein